jgi:hypothetical protein
VPAERDRHRPVAPGRERGLDTYAIGADRGVDLQRVRERKCAKQLPVVAEAGARAVGPLFDELPAALADHRAVDREAAAVVVERHAVEVDLDARRIEAASREPVRPRHEQRDTGRAAGAEAIEPTVERDQLHAVVRQGAAGHAELRQKHGAVRAACELEPAHRQISR